MTTTPQLTRVCPRCRSRRPADEDFCGERLKDGTICGRFLAWTAESDPTTIPGEPPPVARVVAAAAPQRAAVTFDVSVDGAPRRLDGQLVASAAPGLQASLTVRLRNVGRIVETFVIDVQGFGTGPQLPPEWVFISDEDRALELNPFDHQGPSEGFAKIVLGVPAESRYAAGTYGFAISVRSESNAADVQTATGTLHVLSRFAVVASATPLIATGKRSASFKIVVANHGNTPVTPVLRLSDAQERCAFSDPRVRPAVAPRPRPGRQLADGARRRAPREAGYATRAERPSRDAVEPAPAQPAAIPPRDEAVYRRVVHGPRHLIGQPIDHQITIDVAVPGEERLAPLLVVFRQRPLLAWWLIPALLALAALALILFLLWPRSDAIEMPQLRGLSSEYRAEQRLAKAGLTTTPHIRTIVRPRPRAGTIFAQIPAAGEEVEPGQAVTLTVVVPPAFTLIPDLRGYTATRAQSVLTHAHLELGEVLPSKESTGKVIRQLPLALRAYPRGTAVDVVLGAPPPRAIPDVRCLTPKRAQRALERRGFRLHPLSDEFFDPREKIRSQLPAAGTVKPTGFEIQVTFKGEPCPKPDTGGAPSSATAASAVGSAARLSGAVGGLSFDDGASVRLADREGAVGAGSQAAWSPGGKLVALRTGTAIAVRGMGDTARARDVASASVPGAEPGLPAFAPVAGDHPLLAFLATPASGASKLCLVRVGTGALRPACKPLAGVRGRALAWSADARTILVAGARAAAPDRFGIIRVSAESPAERDVARWHVDPALLRPQHGGHSGSVLDLAFGPGGRSLAIVTDIAASGAHVAPQIVVTPADAIRSLRGARWLRRHACQVAWSPDGATMAAVQGHGADGCGGAGRPGRLVAFALQAPARGTEVSDRASRPAWRP